MKNLRAMMVAAILGAGAGAPFIPYPTARPKSTPDRLRTGPWRAVKAPPTQADLDRIAAAQAKRERRAQKRSKK